MNKLQEINGKHYQECEAIMLATDAFPKVGMLNYEPYNSKGNKLELIHYVLTGEGLNPQHLYFLSNEEIKDDDWCYDTLRGCIWQKSSKINCNGEIYKKIIATTDTSLLKDYSEQTLNGVACLPQPPKAFIQAFIKAYNESKPITKVLVEMEKIHVGWKPDYTFENEGIEGSKKMYQYFLKVNSSNEITIKKIKDSYTREETIELIKKFSNHFCPMNNHLEEDEDKWIEENL
ncbi:MAG: hypothetical protein M0R51_06380 [Clostridia bacterium]|jgi:hypothetical protein|nr:hypothetical protein [Clostridia bacterium]